MIILQPVSSSQKSMIIGSMTLLSIQFSLQYSFSILTTWSYIPFSTTDTIKVLYEKIKQKNNPVVYKTDKIANLHEHEVLRTQASIDFRTTQERQHYSSPGDSHHPLIWPETLNRSRQSNLHFAYLHAKQ
jgi:hypothetical protein